MLNINSDIVCSIIAKAREFHAKENVVFPDDPTDASYSYDMMQVLADHQDDLSYQEVKDLIDDLEPDQQSTLIALMYVGRGDYDIEEWQVALDMANQHLKAGVTEYLLSKPLVADYLMEGLVKFGRSCEE